jgi:hypothetical protein
VVITLSLALQVCATVIPGQVVAINYNTSRPSTASSVITQNIYIRESRVDFYTGPLMQIFPFVTNFLITGKLNLKLLTNRVVIF